MVKKINSKDFDIPDDLLPARHTTDAPAKTDSEPAKPKVVKAASPKTSQPTAKATGDTRPALTVRLVFNKDEYKALNALAMTETEKTGKRCSVTSLLYLQANKLIKKGNTNA